MWDASPERKLLLTIFGLLDDETPPAKDPELLKQRIYEVLDTLNPRDRKVIRLRFGFEGGRCHTLEDVAQLFHISRERVRQIEARGLRDLRHPSRSLKLKNI